MSISINTSEYTKSKPIEIDGKKLNIRQMSSAETINLSNLGNEMKKSSSKSDPETSAKLLAEMSDIYFGLYDDKELAKKLLSPLSYEAWWDIYNKVFGVKADV